jgi:isocitrate dehydrogenase
MLNHLGQSDTASKIQNALYKTIESGIHTADIYNSNTSKQKVSTTEFTRVVITNLGNLPQKLNVANFQPTQKSMAKSYVAIKSSETRLLIGCDVFINWQASDINVLLEKLSTLDNKNFVLKTISAKGLALWPSEAVLSQVSSDFLMLRFMGQKITGESSTKIINPNLFVSNLNILQLLQELTEKNIDFVKIENLYSFNNIACFSSGQGE